MGCLEGQLEGKINTPDGKEESMADELRELQEVSTRLNQKSDEVNNTLELFQSKLNFMNVGLEVWLSTPLKIESRTGEPASTTQIEYHLGWAKHDLLWGLVVKKVVVKSGFVDDNYEEPWEEVFDEKPPTELRDASRELRVAALSLLPKMVTALKKKATTTIKEIEDAKKLADSM